MNSSREMTAITAATGAVRVGPSSSSRAASRTPAPAGTISSSGPLAKATANAPVHWSNSSAPPSAPSWRASRYTWTP
jgi:hypothetical protein